MLPILWSACSARQGSDDSGFPPVETVHGCLVAEEHPADDADWDGPTEDEVLAGVAATLPTTITWTISLTAATSPVRVVATRTAAPARVLTYEEFNSADPTAKCSVEPQLTLPMSFEVDIDDGGVVATIDGDLAMGARDEAPTVFGQGPARLDQPWSSEAEAEWATRHDATPPPMSMELVLLSEWPSAKVSVEATDAPWRRRSLFWSGVFSEPAP
jgi:hypothetical protein